MSSVPSIRPYNTNTNTTTTTNTNTNNTNNNNNKRIQRMWNLKCTIIPVIIGATEIVTKSLKKNLEAIPGKHSIDSLQQTVILGTSHIIRKVLQCET
jgi:inosine-uridine nucleoside N-ribohydrolase